MNKAFEQNYFIVEKAIIINPPFQGHFIYPGGLGVVRKLHVHMCAFVGISLSCLICLFVCLHPRRLSLSFKNLRFSLTLLRFPGKLVYPHDHAEASQTNQVSGLGNRHKGNESKGFKSSYLFHSSTRGWLSRSNCSRRTSLFYFRNRHFCEALY